MTDQGPALAGRPAWDPPEPAAAEPDPRTCPACFRQRLPLDRAGRRLPHTRMANGQGPPCRDRGA